MQQHNVQNRGNCSGWRLQCEARAAWIMLRTRAAGKIQSASLASANAPTTKEMLECIARARLRAFTERNIRSGWKKTGIWLRSLNTALFKVLDPRPSTPLYSEADSGADILRTPYSL